MICEVVVDIKTLATNKVYDYLVPSNMVETIKIGQRVIVNFAGRKVLGIVVKIKEQSEYEGLSSILEIMDMIPCLNQELIDLAYNMHNYYFSLYINCLLTMIPAALRVKHKKKFVVLNRDLIPLPIRPFFEKNDYVYLNEYQDYIDVFSEGIKNGSLSLVDEIDDKEHIQFFKYVICNENFDGKLNEAQQEIVDYVKSLEYDELKSDLIKKYSAARIKALLDKKALIEIKKEKIRQFDNNDYVDKVVSLNNEQQEALDKIRNNYGTNNTILLHGVTGSGKTEIYLNVIEDKLKEGKKTILLVPEISLTPQIVARIKGRFKDNVAVLHSGLSAGEKYDQWRRIIKNEVSIVVGARSAIFAPIDNIGAIIVDEEHENSYKQFDSDPRYDAVMIARIRARNHNAITILGSATPSIESYYAALNGRYKLIELANRANQKKSPKVEIVDMKKQAIQGNNSLISKNLYNKINNRLNKNEQIILMLNRRGYSSYMLCRECGNVLKCPHCEVSLTYHKKSNKLVCHYCNYEMKVPNNCPKCSSKNLRFMGSGTEKLVEEVQKEFGEASVLRMDADNTKNKGAHEEIISKFASKEADILIGTQMISKGLDFPYCTLVGILNADTALNYPNYDSAREAYSLFVQTSGRAGRHEIEGEVVIQAYDTTHYALTCAQKEDYVSFYKEEIKYRELGKYPPFYKMIELTFAGLDQKNTYNEAMRVLLRLKKENGLIVLGPVEDYVAKINDKYRFKVTVKYNSKIKIEDLMNQIYSYYLDKKDYNLFITRS